MTRRIFLSCSALFAWSIAGSALAVPPEPDAALGTSAPATRLTIGAKVASGSLRREYAGFVALALPLDGWAAPRKLAQNAERAVPAEPVDAPEPAPDEPETGKQPKASAPAPAQTRVARAAAPITPRAFIALVQSSVRRALESAGVDRKQRELSSLAGRARASATLPELKLRAARSNDEALRLAPTTEDPNRYTLAGGTDLLLEATATWKLDRLLFADEEVAIGRLALERDKAEAVLVQKILARLFAWRRALARSRAAELSPEERADAELDCWEAQAELDVLTGGWFSQRLLELGLAPDLDSSGSPGAAAESPQTAPEPTSVGQEPANALNAARHAR